MPEVLLKTTLSKDLFNCRPAHAVHFAVYEAAKKGLGETVAETSFAGAAAAGATATIISDACMTPFDVIKQRLQVGFIITPLAMLLSDREVGSACR